VDVPFGPPPEEYSYRCSQCDREMAVNEAIIDVEIGIAEFEGRYYEGFMPVLGCPACNHESMEYVCKYPGPEGQALGYP
jgi:hypothetical protein